MNHQPRNLMEPNTLELPSGVFTISLDFELIWVSQQVTLSDSFCVKKILSYAVRRKSVGDEQSVFEQ